MRSFCLIFWIYIFTVYGIFYPEIQNAISAQKHMPSKKENVHFRWAFGARIVKGNEHILIPITADTILKTGDQLKIFFDWRRL